MNEYTVVYTLKGVEYTNMFYAEDIGELDEKLMESGIFDYELIEVDCE